VRAIFEHVTAQAGVREFRVSLSYFEIYNETLKDLLCPAAKLDVVEGLAGVDVRGARPTEVADLAAALRLLAEGDASRATAATAMNAQSSRSHCVVRVTVESKKANGAQPAMRCPRAPHASTRLTRSPRCCRSSWRGGPRPGGGAQPGGSGG
jgi:hypothetical protein